MVSVALITLVPMSFSAPVSEVVASGAQLLQLAKGFSFTEGPTVDRVGNIYFTDQPNDRIVKWSADGSVSDFLKPAGRANGLCFDNQENLWACADGENELWRIDLKTKKPVVVIRDFGGKKLNGPNDLWIRPDGGLYLTDPFYQRPYWDHTAMEQDSEQVYFLPAGGKALVRVTTEFTKPNGIVGTPDGKMLYVADIGAGKTYSYSIQKDGRLTDRKLFCEQGSDGMTIDSEGNVYLTGKGVTVYNRRGEKVQHIDVPENWTANVCIGGKKRNELFITASGAIYAITLRTTAAARE
jgi:gluconolactonase